MACEKCWHPVVGLHNPGCPNLDGSQNEFEEGCREGFCGERISWRTLRFYSLSFRYGYRVGKRELDRALEGYYNDLAIDS